MPEEFAGRDNNDLVLPPNTYAYVLDSTKGKVSVYVGPYKSSLSQTDQLVVWDVKQQKFRPVNDLNTATGTNIMAGEGQYIVLFNPAPGEGAGANPTKGSVTEAVDLAVGRQVNVPGPTTFPLWPGQTAQTIDGHHLRHNQYLVVRVYDAAQAQANWQSAVVAPQVGQDTTPIQIAPPTYAMGQLIVVQGTDVSFYIPPTGIEVVPDETTGSFVREAVTLERLEYCILLDENGEKRYLQGPDVVFPRPTEKFVEKAEEKDHRSQRKFTAVELNDHSGLFVKVIAEYEEDGWTHPVGEELFITGAETAIYYPRPEHSIIMYGNKRVHYAVAIPAGEGRYVLDRDEGTVDLVKGPKMYLPDPRKEVVVLRILDPHIVDLYFPGNEEAKEVNRRYSEMSTRLDPGEHLSNVAASAASAAYGSRTAMPAITKGIVPTTDSFLRTGEKGDGGPILAAAAGGFQAETMKRGTSYTAPRSIVLDTKYEGAVAINVWPGYAVLVVDKTDNRRVEIGPKAVLLQYDEQLMPLTLSTGTPKNDTKLLRTAYLRTVNNQVSDRVIVETRDLVTIKIEISYRVSFEADNDADRQKWFAIENYVKVLTDHCRSKLRNVAKRHGLQEFYSQTIDIIRDCLLGKSIEGERTGLVFADNGMKLFDVEILNIDIEDSSVGDLLIQAQYDAIRDTIALSAAEENAARIVRIEELTRYELQQRELTAVTKGDLAMAALQRQLTLNLETLSAEYLRTIENTKIDDERRTNNDREFDLQMEHQSSLDAIELARLASETTEYIRRMEAFDPTFVAALQQFGDLNFVEKLVSAIGPAALAAGVTTADMFAQIFKGTPFEGATNALANRPFAPVDTTQGALHS